MYQAILSTAYFAPAVYYSIIKTYDQITIEKFENFTKQTYRNRCCILSANGKLTLCIPVKKGDLHKKPITAVEIDYDTNWQKIHWKAIESAYRSSPFYEFYIHDFIPFFRNKYRYLFDLNLAILHVMMTILEMDISKIDFTDRYIKEYETAEDFRYCIHPKRNTQEAENRYKSIEYTQVFGNKFGFSPNLSILDLLFNTGPGSEAIINVSFNKS